MPFLIFTTSFIPEIRIGVTRVPDIHLATEKLKKLLFFFFLIVIKTVRVAIVTVKNSNLKAKGSKSMETETFTFLHFHQTNLRQTVTFFVEKETFLLVCFHL